ncbi:MAG: transposase [Nannocystaceae bacterium]
MIRRGRSSGCSTSPTDAAEALAGFLKAFSLTERAAVEVVVMDMHAPYMNAVSENIPGGDRKIAFDKYHVAAHLGGAVDAVPATSIACSGGRRRAPQGHQVLLAAQPRGDERGDLESFEVLRESALKTARLGHQGGGHGHLGAH